MKRQISITATIDRMLARRDMAPKRKRPTKSATTLPSMADELLDIQTRLLRIIAKSDADRAWVKHIQAASRSVGEARVARGFDERQLPFYRSPSEREE
jgi:hypothetical protein